MQTSMKRFPQFVNLFNENLRYAERDFYDSKFSKYKKSTKMIELNPGNYINR